MTIPRIDSPLKLTATYVLFGTAWILVSDGLMARNSGAGFLDWVFSAIKGVAFVGVTGFLLHILVRRLVGRHQAAESALRDSQQRLALALDAANQGMYDFNVRTGSVEVNDTFATMLGYDPKDFRMDRDRWVNQMHPQDREQAVGMLAEYLGGRSKDYRVEFRLRAASGDWRWMFSVGRVVERDAAGQPVRMLGTHTDITDRKNAEAQGADALAFARTVLHSSPVGVIAYGADGQAVMANRAAARIIGTDVSGLLRQNYRTLDSWRRHGLLVAAERALAEDRSVTHRGPVLTSFGRSIWVQTQFVPFTYKDERHLLFIISDETESHQAQQTLRLMEAAVQAAPVGWVVTDPEGRIEWVNPGFTTLTGYTAAEVIGQNPRLLKSGRHGAGFYQAMWAAIKQGEVWTGEICNQRKDGGQYEERMTIAPVRDEAGNIAHYVAIKQDVTGEKQLEQQLARAQRLESIGMLASGIAHDLNNIFAPILLSLELLKLKFPAADALRLVELVEKAGQRGAGIVRQLLTFARGVEGERTEVHVKYVVKETAQMLGETLPRAIRVESVVAPDLPPVLGDATQLHQVMLNLAINARDAMPEGGVLRFEAQVVHLDDSRAARNHPLKPGPCVALTVSDTGTGIPPEVLEHMFEPFYTTKPLGKGTGLGLSTVYGIVRGHGGAVEVVSAPGQGARFTVLLPMLRAPAQTDGSHPPMAGVIAGAGRRILVVDDEEPIRLITQQMLQRHGFVVEAAGDGIEALAMLRQEPGRFSAVITDLMMPRMNGRELAGEIRRLAPALPVIASSGLSEEDSSTEGVASLVALGVRHLLRKPYVEGALLAVLGRALDPGVAAAKSP